jgi:hypothetical protein
LKLRDIGAEKTFWRVKGKGIHVWSLPQVYFGIDEKTDSFDLPPLSGEQEVL